MMINRRTLWFSIMFGVIAVAGYLSTFIPFESDPNPYALIPETDRIELEQFEKAFSQGNPMTILVLEHKNGWKNYTDFLTLNKATEWWKCDTCKNTDSTTAMSITNVPFPVLTYLGIKKRAFAKLSSEEKFLKWFSRADKFPDITSKFLSKNRKYTLLFVPSADYSPKKVKAFENKFQSDNITVLPLDYNEIQAELQATNERETTLLAGISLLIILGVFFILTGSLRGLIFIFTLTCFSLSLTALFVYFSGMVFSVHMVAIPCMLIVLSFTDLMHLLHAHDGVRSQVNSNAELRKTLGKSLHRPMLLTSLTNMVGFVLFLWLANNHTLQDISLLSIAGVIFAFLSSRFIALQTLRTTDVFFPKQSDGKWQGLHEKILAKLYPKRKILLVFSSVLTVVLGLFLFKNLSVGNVPFVVEGEAKAFKAVNVLSHHFFGDKTASIHVTYESEDALWNDKTMHYFEVLEAAIDAKFEPVVISSPTVIAKRYHRFQRSGHPGAYSLPVEYDSLMRASAQNFGGGGVVNTKERKARIQFSFANIPLEASLNKMTSMERFLEANPPPKGVQVKLLGSAYLNDHASHNFSTNILYGLLLSVIFGALLTFLFVRDFTVLWATLLANSLPLLVALVVLYLSGNELNPISLFFFTVIMGLCVDDSIYLIIHRNANRRSSIYPIAITSVVLAIGFASFLFSSYDWIRPFGWVFLIAIIVAFIFDALLLVLFTERNSTFDPDV